MSRIHEALKKAAKERQPVVEIELEVPEAEQAKRRVPLIEHSDAVFRKTEAVAKDARPQYLNYEALITHCVHPEWQIDALTSVFRNPSAGNGAAERFRMLRSRLYHVATTRTMRRILVTSGVAGEGKTFVAANLAQSIVQQPERRVLLIDADLRAPRLHLAFGATPAPGLTEYLRGEADEFQVIQKGAEENLCLVCAGAHVDKPTEILLNPRMKQLLDKVTPLFDWVIIDSPPALPVQDASDLAHLTDGVLVVLRAGATHAHAAEKTVAEFKNKNLLGVVLNQVKGNDFFGGYYYSQQNATRAIPAL
jgi:protein-tyrosine kinase